MLLTIFILILFLVIFVPSLLLSIVARILDIFSFGRKRRVEREDGAQRNWQQARDAHSAHDTYDHSGKSRNQNHNHKKIFDKDEGEYVDFEEIK